MKIKSIFHSAFSILLCFSSFSSFSNLSLFLSFQHFNVFQLFGMSHNIIDDIIVNLKWENNEKLRFSFSSLLSIFRLVAIYLPSLNGFCCNIRWTLLLCMWCKQGKKRRIESWDFNWMLKGLSFSNWLHNSGLLVKQEPELEKFRKTKEKFWVRKSLQL